MIGIMIIMIIIIISVFVFSLFCLTTVIEPNDFEAGTSSFYSKVCFTAVPYDSRKPFSWQDYLVAAGAKAVPLAVFKQVSQVVSYEQ